MAFQVGSACYGTALEAAQVAASSQIGSLVGGAPYSVSVSSVTADAITFVLSPIGGGAAITHVAPFAAQPCNMLQLADGVQMGWLVAGAWIGAFALLFIAKALRGETGNDYGNT